MGLGQCKLSGNFSSKAIQMTSSDVRVSLGPMTPLRKIYAGSDTRKTRLHDELGEAVSLGRLLRNGPRALLTGAARVLLGRRPEQIGRAHV